MDEKTKTLMRSVTKQMGAFLFRHKVSVVLAAVVCYVVFWPKRIPQTSATNGPEIARATGGTANNPTNELQQLDPILLHEPGEAGGDPKWAVPAELSTDEIKNVIQQLDAAGNVASKLADSEQHYLAQMTLLLDDKVKALLWPRVKGEGFKDQKLASDWYEIVKGKNGLMGGAEIGTEISVNNAVEVPMAIRLLGIRDRAIGGKVFVGDVLYLKVLQTYFDHRLAYYGKKNPVIDNVVARMESEFPGQFGDKQPVEPPPSPQQAFEDAQKNFAPPGFKSLVIGMGIDALRDGYVIIKEDTAIGQTTISLNGDRSLRIGSYPLTAVSAFFYQGQLCQISLKFEANRAEIFNLFQKRFGFLSESKIDWTRGSTHLKAKVADKPGADGYAVILGTPTNPDGTNVEWGEIEFLDKDLMKQANRTLGQAF